jgi:hypothetical protein
LLTSRLRGCKTVSSTVSVRRWRISRKKPAAGAMMGAKKKPQKAKASESEV